MTRLLGAHMSIAGGYHKAVEAAAELGMTTCQIFTKNNNQWRGKPISEGDEKLFRDALQQGHIGHPVSHSSYLINLGSPDPVLWEKSVDAMVVELQRAAQLAVPYVVMHPGAHTTASEEEGLANIVRGIDEVHRRAGSKVGSQILLENTAGQGSCLGWRFEHLADILNRVADADRLGVCFDTCHAFAAGYELADKEKFRSTFAEFDEIVGLKRIKAFHLNDSKKELGSRVDRHEHIGRGKVGLDAFRHLMNDERFEKTPMYLETPKGLEDGEELDAINLQTLRALVAK